MRKRRSAALKRKLVDALRVGFADIGLIRKPPVAPAQRTKLMAIVKELKAIDRERGRLWGRTERMVAALERLPVENRLIEVWRGGRYPVAERYDLRGRG